MPDEVTLDLAAMDAAAEKAVRSNRAEAISNHRVAWRPENALAVLRRLRAAEAVCEALAEWRDPRDGELPDWFVVVKAFDAWRVTQAQGDQT